MRNNVRTEMRNNVRTEMRNNVRTEIEKLKSARQLFWGL